MLCNLVDWTWFQLGWVLGIPELDIVDINWEGVVIWFSLDVDIWGRLLTNSFRLHNKFIEVTPWSLKCLIIKLAKLEVERKKFNIEIIELKLKSQKFWRMFEFDDVINTGLGISDMWVSNGSTCNEWL